VERAIDVVTAKGKAGDEVYETKVGSQINRFRHESPLNFTGTLTTGVDIDQTKIAVPLVAPSLNDFRFDPQIGPTTL
jgi:hypothetical protein